MALGIPAAALVLIVSSLQALMTKTVYESARMAAEGEKQGARGGEVLAPPSATSSCSAKLVGMDFCENTPIRHLAPLDERMAPGGPEECCKACDTTPECQAWVFFAQGEDAGVEEAALASNSSSVLRAEGSAAATTEGVRDRVAGTRIAGVGRCLRVQFMEYPCDTTPSSPECRCLSKQTTGVVAGFKFRAEESVWVPGV